MSIRLLTALVILLCLLTGHYKRDGGAGVGIFGDSRFKDGPFFEANFEANFEAK